MPYNVVTGDHVKVDYVDPNTGTPGSREFKITKTADGKITATDIINGGTPQDITKTNTIQVDNVPMKPGEKTKVDATITTQDDQTEHASAEAKLAQLSSKGLSVSIAADANDNGTITRDETSSNTSKVSVSLPGSVIAGDSIKVEITNAGSTTPVTKEFKVLSKDALGNIELQDQHNLAAHPITLENGKPLELEAAIAVGQETKAKVTLSDGTTTVSTEDHAKVEMDAIRGMQFSEDGNRDGHLYGNENFGGNNKTQDTTPVKIYVSDDARAGDTVEIKYTHPDNHTQVKTVEHELTADDISKGVFDQLLDINARSAYDLKVDATLKTPGGLVNKTHSDTLRIELEDFRMDYDPSKVMKGGEGTSDTIVFRDTSHVDLSNVADLNTKVESIERIELKGNSEIKFDAKDIFAMTDNINTILKIRGDSTSKVDIKGKWHEDPSVNADFGSKGYTSNDTVNDQAGNAHTVHIIIEDKIQTDL